MTGAEIDGEVFSSVILFYTHANLNTALTGLAQWIEHLPADWWVPGLILVKGVYLGCGHIPSRRFEEAAN